MQTYYYKLALIACTFNIYIYKSLIENLHKDTHKIYNILLSECWVPEEYMPMRSYAYLQAYCFMKANWKPYLRQIGYEH
jgi:hypothetical protein